MPRRRAFRSRSCATTTACQLIGLIPSGTDRERLIADITAAGRRRCAGLRPAGSRGFPRAPKAGTTAVRFAVAALRSLPRSKISVEAGRVSVKAMTDSDDAQSAGSRRICPRRAPRRRAACARPFRAAPGDHALHPAVPARRENGARFDACSADTEERGSQILQAATAAGLEGKASCTIGLGVSHQSLGRCGRNGNRRAGRTRRRFDHLFRCRRDPDREDGHRAGRLSTASWASSRTTSPKSSTLHAVLPKPPEETPEGPPEFTATLSPQGDGAAARPAVLGRVAHHDRKLCARALRLRRTSIPARGWMTPARLLAGARSGRARGAVETGERLV